MESACIDHPSLSLDLRVGPLRLPDQSPIGQRKLHTNPMHVEEGGDSFKDEAEDLEAKFNRMSEENKKLNELLSAIYADYGTLQSQLFDLMSTSPKEKGLVSPSRKRKSESLEAISFDDKIYERTDSISNRVDDASSEHPCKRLMEDPKPQILKVYVKTDPSDTSLVQKSAEDTSIIVATYEGEHNHVHPSQTEVAHGSCHNGSLPCSVSINSSGPTITLDLTQQGMSPGGSASREIESPAFQRLLAEQMASSLTRDPNFTSALATAISGRIFRHPPA